MRFDLSTVMQYVPFPLRMLEPNIGRSRGRQVTNTAIMSYHRYIRRKGLLCVPLLMGVDTMGALGAVGRGGGGGGGGRGGFGG